MRILPLLTAAALALSLGLAHADDTTSPMAAKAMSAAKDKVAAVKDSAKVDLNSASEEDLAKLPGIGDKRAAKIVAGRPYSGKDDLVTKKIIPKSLYSKIKDQIIAKQK